GVASGPAGATPTASSPWARPIATRSATAGTRRGDRTRTVGTRPSCRSPGPRATRPSALAPGRASPRATDVARRWEQPRVRQHAEGPCLRDVDHHRRAGLARADERHQAVGATLGALPGAVVAVNAWA